MIDLKDIGLTQEQLQERVINAIADRLLLKRIFGEDDEDDEWTDNTSLKSNLERVIKQRIDEQITKLADERISPNIAEFINNLTLQQTTAWGEKKGQPMSFLDYLVSRAENYLTEKVNYEGKSKDESSYSWSGTQTRLTYMVHQHLHYSIKDAMEKAVKRANEVLVNGLAETAKMKLEEISKSLKISVTTKS